jgi:porin
MAEDSSTDMPNKVIKPGYKNEIRYDDQDAQTIQPGDEDREEKYREGRYQANHSFGGPAETGRQLEENDKDTYPLFRFPASDEFTASWKAWKHDLNKRTGFKFGFDYTTLFQKISDSLAEAKHDTAFSSVARIYGKWELVNRGTENKGSLSFKIDHRNIMGSHTSPSRLGGEAGYLSQTGVLFSDADTVLVDFNWQQSFNNGTSGMIIGRYDPNDYMDVLGYANPWTGFSNLDTMFNMSIALPDAGMGIAAGHRLTDAWYILGGFNDANGTVDTTDLFDGGSEFFKFAEVGWSPSKADRYFKNVNVTAWHMDDRTAYGKDDASNDGSQGIAVAANWTWNLEWMVFAKIGFSDVDSPTDAQLYEQDAKIGFIKYFERRSDLIGMSISRGEIAEEFGTPNDVQLTFEAFYRMQLAKNFSITANFQYLKDPALNTRDDVRVLGLRTRFTL